MSKQLTLSATIAVLSMAAFALASTVVGISQPDQAHRAASAPLIGHDVLR